MCALNESALFQLGEQGVDLGEPHVSPLADTLLFDHPFEIQPAPAMLGGLNNDCKATTLCQRLVGALLDSKSDAVDA